MRQRIDKLLLLPHPVIILISSLFLLCRVYAIQETAPLPITIDDSEDWVPYDNQSFHPILAAHLDTQSTDDLEISIKRNQDLSQDIPPQTGATPAVTEQVAHDSGQPFANREAIIKPTILTPSNTIEESIAEDEITNDVSSSVGEITAGQSGSISHNQENGHGSSPFDQNVDQVVLGDSQVNSVDDTNENMETDGSESGLVRNSDDIPTIKDTINTPSSTAQPQVEIETTESQTISELSVQTDSDQPLANRETIELTKSTPSNTIEETNTANKIIDYTSPSVGETSGEQGSNIRTQNQEVEQESLTDVRIADHDILSDTQINDSKDTNENADMGNTELDPDQNSGQKHDTNDSVSIASSTVALSEETESPTRVLESYEREGKKAGRIQPAINNYETRYFDEEHDSKSSFFPDMTITPNVILSSLTLLSIIAAMVYQFLLKNDSTPLMQPVSVMKESPNLDKSSMAVSQSSKDREIKLLERKIRILERRLRLAPLEASVKELQTENLDTRLTESKLYLEHIKSYESLLSENRMLSAKVRMERYERLLQIRNLKDIKKIPGILRYIDYNKEFENREMKICAMEAEDEFLHEQMEIFRELKATFQVEYTNLKSEIDSVRKKAQDIERQRINILTIEIDTRN